MEFRILGPLEVVEDGRPLPLDRRRMRSLLAFMLLHANEPISADRLVDEVWGPEPPKTAAASLQNYVSRLRKTIGTETLGSQPPGYVLRIDPERFDLARFERLAAEARRAEARERAEKLRAALALWRGPALEDLAFEPFVRDEAGRLEEARLAALEDCIDAELETGGDESGLVTELEELVEEHPLRERFRGQLMRALYRVGRQADALAAYQSARIALTEELGLEPGEKLRALQQAILRHDPSLEPSAQGAEERAADRRTVTVLFCDLVGSTELAARLDPEAYRTLLFRYFELVRGPIEGHGGTLEKFIGDAVLAVFGVPELHEDDALRAVRAAVLAQRALAEAEIAARIGIATGEVHVLSAADDPLHVSGPPASVASRLEARANAGAVLVSNATHALVGDAVRAERAGEDAWLVHEVVPGAPGYARQLDAPLIGRRHELERLRSAYDDVFDGHCRVVTVVGEAGIGKTRLLRELLLPVRDEARILVGRCASYGEGATYLPLAEAVKQAAPSAEGIAALLENEPDGAHVARRVAELTGLADEPGASNEAFWAVRRFLEALSRERPLVLVLDDIHWAEPTLLDLVEYLGEWAESRLLVLCAARGELLEARPSWGGPTSTGFVLELGALAAQEVAELLAHLSAEPDVADRIVEQAGGNPLFAEQLFALSTEAPELDELPRTIEALLGSRLDRLEARQLAVLRRGAVIGRRFTRPELGDLTPPGDAQQTEQLLNQLTERALLRTRDHAFAFQHVLVRDVAYRGIPKSERADLHELAARGVERRGGADELIGYHFEQAHGALTEIGLADDRVRELAQAGSEHLGRAGIRAWQRADAHAALNLLSRSVELSPTRTDAACELAVVLYVHGELDRAKDLLAAVASSGDSRLAARAHVELANFRSMSEPDRAEELAAAAAASLPILERVEDDRALGRVWLSISHVRGDFFCEYGVMEEAATRAVGHYRRAGWSPSTALSSLGLALYFGPKPVADGIATLEALREEFDDDRASEANLMMWLGGLAAMGGDIEAGRTQIVSARDRYLDLGLTTAAADLCERLLGLAEALDGNFEDAESHLRTSCATLEQRGESQVLATRAGELARVLYRSKRYDEADDWTRKAQASSGKDDLDAALTWQPVEAMLLARCDRAESAERRLRELMRQTPGDAVLAKAEALLALAEVLRLARRDDEAAEAVTGAIALYERKGNLAAARLVRQREEPRRGSSLLR